MPLYQKLSYNKAWQPIHSFSPSLVYSKNTQALTPRQPQQDSRSSAAPGSTRACELLPEAENFSFSITLTNHRAAVLWKQCFRLAILEQAPQNLLKFLKTDNPDT